MEAEFLHNPHGLALHAHSAHLLEATDGTLLAVWYAYPGPEDHKGATLVLARKPAGGAWEKARPILEELESSAGNPVLTQDPTTGHLRLYFVLLRLYWTDAAAFTAESTDMGRTWSTPARLWDQKGLMFRHSPVATDSGTLLLPMYDDVRHRSHIFQGRDAEWQCVHTFDGPVIQPVIVRNGAGGLRAFFRPQGEPRIIWRAGSDDGGKTWSALIRTTLPCPLSGIAAFAYGDALAVVYNHTELHQRSPLSIAVSRDGGITWSAPWHIDHMAKEASYPSFLLGSDGRVHGVYTYNRRMIKYLAFPPEDLPHGV